MDAPSTELTVTALDRLFIGASAEAGNHTASLDYIPGPMVLGAFANLWIRQHGVPQGNPRREEFVELFHGSVRWPALMPDGGTFIPLSVQVCKYGSRRGDPACLANSIDLLFDPPVDRCPHCHGPMEGSKGAFIHARRSRVTRVALETIDGRERAKDTMLYSRDGIAVGSVLRGVIHGSHPWLTAIAAASDPVDLWFGGARSVAGHCHGALVTAPADAENPPDSDVATETGEAQVDIRAEAPCIFVTNDGRPSADPSTSELAELLGRPVTIARRWVRTGTVSGWHAASGLPRPMEIVALPGSVWRLRVDNLDPTRLAGLRRGIGLRTTEGFGAVAVNPTRFTFPVRGSAVATPDPLMSRLSEFTSVFCTSPTRRWAGDLLLESSDRQATGQPALFSDVVEHRAANRRLKEGQRHVLRRAMADLDAGQLKRLALLLQNAKGEQ